jgi:hypothetical protein
MAIYDTVFSPDYALNERIARAVFEVFPECGLLVAILDREGNCWSSDPEAFGKLNLTEGLLCDLQAKVDDGAEPTATQVGDASVTMAQLATEHTNCGYLLLAISRCGQESIPVSFDMVEAIVGLITLVAGFVEKEGLLGEAQMKFLSVYGTAGAPVN